STTGSARERTIQPRGQTQAPPGAIRRPGRRVPLRSIGASLLDVGEKAELTFGGLRSAEPRFSEPWPPFGRAGEDRVRVGRPRRRPPSRLKRRGAHLCEGLGDRL